jgi:hypothetical protein
MNDAGVLRHQGFLAIATRFEPIGGSTTDSSRDKSGTTSLS